MGLRNVAKMGVGTYLILAQAAGAQGMQVGADYELDSKSTKTKEFFEGCLVGNTGPDAERKCAAFVIKDMGASFWVDTRNSFFKGCIDKAVPKGGPYATSTVRKCAAEAINPPSMY